MTLQRGYKIFLIISIVILLGLATVLFVKGLGMSNASSLASSGLSNEAKEVIARLKKENENLVYESSNIPEFTSLVFFKDERIVFYLVAATSGELLSIEDIIKEDEQENFLAKEQDLLALKYPEFLIQGINNSEGTKSYWLKENELIIYYYDYTYEYSYQEEVSLTINYNEIHDYLNFTHVLDREYTNEDGFDYSSDKKTVAITFDDGPGEYNAEFLEVLAQNKAHATFFMVGYMMEDCGKCVLDTYNSGNEVGSHTYNHINIKKSSKEEVAEEIAQTDALFYQITGSHIKYVRPPYGAYSKENKENVEYPLILWNIDTEDWRYRDVDYIVNYVMENVSDGSIILMHELYETSLEALKIILPMLYAEGYQVVSISELAKLQGKELLAGHVYRAMMD